MPNKFVECQQCPALYGLDIMSQQTHHLCLLPAQSLMTQVVGRINLNRTQHTAGKALCFTRLQIYRSTINSIINNIKSHIKDNKMIHNIA